MATVRDLLAGADDAARQIGGDQNHYWTSFGPTNVQIHGVEIAVELEQPDRALQRARTLRLPRSLSRERVVHHGIDVARALCGRLFHCRLGLHENVAQRQGASP